jgi:CRP-like cAMP-binding protein
MPSVVFAQLTGLTELFMTDNHSSNQLLAALPFKEYQRLEPNLKPFRLEYGDAIFNGGALIKHVYFPLGGIVSLLSAVDERSMLEVGIVGREGMVGLPVFLGVRRSANRAIVQGSGESVRLTTAAFLAECSLQGELPVLLRRFTQSLMSQISQSAVCFRFHSVEQRLARWLLMTSDRVGSNYFQLTQEFLSNMLGVRREAVNKSAVEFHSRGLINYSRGRIKIIARKKLEQAACKCYELIKREEFRAAHTKVRRK